MSDFLPDVRDDSRCGLTQNFKRPRSESEIDEQTSRESKLPKSLTSSITLVDAVQSEGVDEPPLLDAQQDVLAQVDDWSDSLDRVALWQSQVMQVGTAREVDTFLLQSYQAMVPKCIVCEADHPRPIIRDLPRSVELNDRIGSYRDRCPNETWFQHTQRLHLSFQKTLSADCSEWTVPSLPTCSCGSMSTASLSGTDILLMGCSRSDGALKDMEDLPVADDQVHGSSAPQPDKDVVGMIQLRTRTWVKETNRAFDQLLVNPQLGWHSHCWQAGAFVRRSRSCHDLISKNKWT